jgi:hypothetical protein
MLGEVAVTLLKMAGHSGSIPSAIRAVEVPGALDRMKRALDNMGPEQPLAKKAEEDQEPPVGLKVRAYPLIELLVAASAKNADVTWEEEGPVS